MTFKDSKPPE